jgi:bifunctional pyridoxal-dependent enzyme with beta-cystathionase and maltose regulon repressor activities
VPLVNALGFAATLVAFRDCADWHAELLDYLRGNRDSVIFYQIFGQYFFINYLLHRWGYEIIS